jgi:zinc transport system substrate-binding protein
VRTTLANLAILVAMVAGCGGNGPVEVSQVPEGTTDRLVVYTVNYPLAHFAQRIGGDLVEVVFPAPSDGDPALWSPDAETIAAYQSADLILLNGADYAKWVQRATLPGSRVVDTGAAISDRLIELGGVTTHSHGPEGEHEHGGWAFTTWLDPDLAGLQAEAVAASLIAARPSSEAEINQRFGALSDELRELDQRLAAAAEAIGDEPLLFSHPVYQYLIRRYELNAREIHWEPDELPDGHAWSHLEEMLQSHPARWMLWEGEPLPETVSGLQELGITALVFDPCSLPPEQGDYMAAMSANAASLEAITP